MAYWGDNFNSGELVDIDIQGSGNFSIKGKVVGLSMQHIIDFYIVLLEEPIASYNDSKGNPWSAAVFPNTLMRRRNRERPKTIQDSTNDR